MNRRLFISTLVLGALVAGNAHGQLPDAATQIYTLLAGSELMDDCPVCDRPTIVAPMTGTFRLRFLDQNPLVTRYAIEAITFHAGNAGGPNYQVSGGGTYQVGGEVAVTQDVFLDATINNGFTNTAARCVNTDRKVTQPWPEIQATVTQTNGTAAVVYSLTLVAAPALQFRAIIPDYARKDVTLKWEGNGRQAQVERAPAVAGPYSAVSAVTTNETFTDAGALTNAAVFYRLRGF